MKRTEKRKQVKISDWVREKDPGYGYSETSMMQRIKRAYGLRSKAKPIERSHSLYSYSSFEDGYNGWQDNYRTDYRGSQYDTYDSLYDTDYDPTYKYRSRGYDYDYYDDNNYSSYYDDYDTENTNENSYSESQIHNNHEERRRRNMSDNSMYLYGYEEFHPEHRHHSSNKRNRKYTYSETKPRHRSDRYIYAVHDILGQKGFLNTTNREQMFETTSETEMEPTYGRHNKNNQSKTKPKNISDTNIYAVPDMSGQKGFKYKKYKTKKTQKIPEIISVTDIEPPYRGQMKRKSKPKYKIYSTQVTKNAIAFIKKLKSPSPKRLMSGSDYEEIPVLNSKQNNKKSESNIVYLPVVAKEKDKNESAHKINMKTPRYQNSTESAEKPLEGNIFQYEKNKESKTNLNHFTENQKSVNVYPVSSRTSQVFRGSAANPNVNRKSRNSVISGNFSDQVPNNGSYIVQTTNRPTGTRNEVMNMTPTTSEGSVKVRLQGSMDEIPRSMAEPSENKEFKRSASKTSRARDQSIARKSSTVENKEFKRSASKTSRARDQSIARKSSTVEKMAINNNDADTEMQGQNIRKSGLRQSYVKNMMFKQQNDVNENQSLPAGQPRYAGGFQNNSQWQTIPLKSIIKQNKSGAKNVSEQQHFSTNQQYSGANFTDLEGHDLKRNPSMQNTAAPKSVARQSNVLSNSQTSIVNKNNLDPQQTEVQKRSTARKSSVAQKGQSVLDRDRESNIEGSSTRRSLARQSGVNQRDKSVVSGVQVTGIEQRSSKIMARQSGAAKMGGSFVKNNQVSGVQEQNNPRSMVGLRQSNVTELDHSWVIVDHNTEAEGKTVEDKDKGFDSERWITQKSLTKQSGISKIGQSFGNQDKELGSGGQNTQKSITKQSSVAQRGQSVAGGDLVMGIQQRSMARQSGAAKSSGSFVDKNQVSGIKDQSTRKSKVRQSNVTQLTGIQQRSMARQSGAAQSSRSFVDKDLDSGISDQSTRKSKGRQSNVTELTGIQQQSMARQSGAAKSSRSFVDKNLVSGIKKQSTPKSKVRQSNVTELDHSFVFIDDNMEVEGRKTQKSVGGKSSLVPREVRDQVEEDENSQESMVGQGRSGLRGLNYEDGMQQRKSSTIRKTASNIKQPSKTKSKSRTKGAFSKLGSFSKKKGQTEKDQDSVSSTPMLDMILSHENRQSKSYQPQTSVSNVIQPEHSSVSIKRGVSSKPKISKKSKLSKLGKSLFGRSKKHDSKQRPSSYNEYVPEAMGQTYDGHQQYSSEEANVQYGDYTDVESLSQELMPKKSMSNDKSEDFPPMLNGYDLTNILYFLQVAQFIVGVTIYDKLMEVFAVL